MTSSARSIGSVQVCVQLQDMTLKSIAGDDCLRPSSMLRTSIFKNVFACFDNSKSTLFAHSNLLPRQATILTMGNQDELSAEILCQLSSTDISKLQATENWLCPTSIIYQCESYRCVATFPSISHKALVR